MKNYIVVFSFFIVLFTGLHAQTKNYSTQKGIILFDAAKSNIEPIKAENNRVRLILDTNSGKIACLMSIRDFVFKNKLMQEHFNENYLESDKYPKASFIGNIKDFDTFDFTTSPSIFVEGTFTIHGVSQKKTVTLQITQKEDKFMLTGNFSIALKNFNIKIPSVLFYKITEQVEISLTATLNK